MFFYAHDKIIENKTEVFPYEINCILTTTGLDAGNITKGDVYYGTNEGLFYESYENGDTDYKKIPEINGSVNYMVEDLEGGIILTTDYNRLYYVNNKREVRQDFDVPDRITFILVIKTNGTESRIGDIYFGTTKGVYFKRPGITANKIEHINGYVKSIQENKEGSIFVLLGEPKKIIEYVSNIYDTIKHENNKLNTEIKTLKNDISNIEKKVNRLVHYLIS